jgi:hypothetical protein
MWHFVFLLDFPNLQNSVQNMASVQVQEGTHIVCVIQQNIAVLVQRAHLTADFNAQYLEKIICSTEGETCINTVCKLPSILCSLQVTLCSVQF